MKEFALTSVALLVLPCLAQGSPEPALFAHLETCAPVAGGRPQTLRYPNVAVKYTRSATGEITLAQIYRSSGYGDFDERVLRAVRTCLVRGAPVGTAGAIGEEIVSISVAQTGRLLRGDRPVIVDAKQCEPKPEDYPAFSRRALEIGVTTISYTVGKDGRLADAEVIKSSGYRRLDSASLNLLATCEFRAGRSIDGDGVGGVFVVDYKWQLQ